MKPKEMFDLVELIDLLAEKPMYITDDNKFFVKALLTLAYEIHLVQEAIEDMDNDIRGYDP